MLELQYICADILRDIKEDIGINNIYYRFFSFYFLLLKGDIKTYNQENYTIISQIVQLNISKSEYSLYKELILKFIDLMEQIFIYKNNNRLP